MTCDFYWLSNVQAMSFLSLYRCLLNLLGGKRGQYSWEVTFCYLQITSHTFMLLSCLFPHDCGDKSEVFAFLNLTSDLLLENRALSAKMIPGFSYLINLNKLIRTKCQNFLGRPTYLCPLPFGHYHWGGVV